MSKFACFYIEHRLNPNFQGLSKTVLSEYWIFSLLCPKKEKDYRVFLHIFCSN